MNNKNSLSQANVDLAEIDKFSSVATRWWDQTSEFQPLHRINPLRLNYILQHADGLFGKKVLDIGCGGGILSESMAKEGALVTGIDMATEPLEVAKLHALESNVQINYLQETAESHAEKYPKTYDIVTCMEMLEHVPDPESIVQSCATLVKPGGHVFFSTINRNKKAWLLAIIAAEYILKMVPKGTHDVKKFIRPSELLNWVDKTSLQEQHITGLHYNPISDKFFLGSNVDVNYMLHLSSTKNC
ncbi:MAG TPA: bifunctional 2-polyprenyl-6-hydroxyphenol methylase/3-demethylubiquinol 3-O-methyltransferase UbiG [Arsenophonus apicola]|jgi:2-polyprenyl-6-hydroxyphenyl methylase / 3-demethylubiquinone-9 3-methyltransferase|uniref:bifunctional 2-polyprenyl-6-hydroxyphenol methylase/3-demethylubiquinol 3-O-methyltransferase UbiG n=1 Tax=Arsenophonus TaxID=637 RepID=UPI0015D7703C|nr:MULTISPECIES: bifunctional 2-polyprenyl-6-hydroxyphenol methylase/3-demethylubiquinol 3-O-methyltransferase UbiG [Arsenophonus]UBX30067.1 bifunctional 2-polyprenyl-6-hydroxyphenol methylase/3-demethylubiquinol 3-O-methyltransferase UbiG [Arsenophonus apicola]